MNEPNGGVSSSARSVRFDIVVTIPSGIVPEETSVYLTRLLPDDHLDDRAELTALVQGIVGSLSEAVKLRRNPPVSLG